MSCPRNTGGSCFSTTKTSDVAFLGNKVHDVGLPNSSALNHGVYFSTDSNHLDVGWNSIWNVRGGRGIQAHSTVLDTGSGHDQYDIRVHDNIIHDTQCDGIVLATIDPSKGKVEVYNNIVYNAGQGPNNPERTGHWACFLLSGYTNAGPPGRGTVELYNNTFYNCGSFASPPYANARAAVANGGHNPNLRIRLRNNLISQPGGAPYLVTWRPSGVCGDSDGCDGIVGSNNLFFGNGLPPRNNNIVNSQKGDPLFVNPAACDFHLRPGSAALGTGIDAGAAFDFEGRPRAGNGGYDLGAIQSTRP
jgi:hypothetical protein